MNLPQYWAKQQQRAFGFWNIGHVHKGLMINYVLSISISSSLFFMFHAAGKNRANRHLQQQQSALSQRSTPNMGKWIGGERRGREKGW
jgi:hypothetical protein